MDKALLDIYTDYLISSFGATTATGLSALLDGTISHDQITRFLSASPQKSPDLWLLVKPIVRRIQSPEAILSVDDSIEEKPYTDESDLVCSHWDHAKGRYIRGINFLTALYQSEGWTIPVGFDLVKKTERVTDPKTGKEKKKSLTTKNERYRELLQACRDNRLPFRYVLNDVWYASAENMRFVKETLGKDFIMPLKSNRKVALSVEDKRAGKYQAVETVEIEEQTVREVHLEGVPFPLRLAKRVFTNEDGSQGVLYLVTSDTTLSWERTVAIYHKRWKAEEYHRSLKQNASLAKSPTQTETTQTNHFFASVWAYVKLEVLKQTTSLNHYALKSKLYVSAVQTALRELQRMKDLQPGLSILTAA